MTLTQVVCHNLFTNYLISMSKDDDNKAWSAVKIKLHNSYIMAVLHSWWSCEKAENLVSDVSISGTMLKRLGKGEN